MTLDQIQQAASELADDELRFLEEWIRTQLTPRVAELADDHPVDGELDEVSYKLKYFKCGKKSCRCSRGALHGPYLYVYRRIADGSLRTSYVGKVAVERQDEARQLALEFR